MFDFQEINNFFLYLFTKVYLLVSGLAISRFRPKRILISDAHAHPSLMLSRTLIWAKSSTF